MNVRITRKLGYPGVRVGDIIEVSDLKTADYRIGDSVWGQGPWGLILLCEGDYEITEEPLECRKCRQ